MVEETDQDGALSSFGGQLDRFKHGLDESSSTSASSSPRTRSATKRTLDVNVAREPGKAMQMIVDRALAENNAEYNSSQLTSPSTTTPRLAKRRRRNTSNNSSLSKSAKSSKTTSPSSPPINNLRDSLREGLILVSIGVNPGIMTGLTGEAYRHPSNRYWPTLYASGITPIPHKPSDTHDLVDLYGMGHTNMVAHIASRAASDLTTQDWMDGAAALDGKIRRFKPEAVCLVGEGIFQQWFRYKEGRAYSVKKDGPVKFGVQEEKYWIGRREEDGYAGAVTWVVTTTSGASTKFSTEERVAIWKPLGDWFAPKRDAWIKAREEAGKSRDVDHGD